MRPAARVSPKPKKLLEGIRVADFTALVAGPTATRMMADAGAEIIKIELPPSGDSTRRLEEREGPFVQFNRGKKDICIDYKRPEGKQVIDRLIAISDVVVENFSPGVMARHGFSYEAVSRINPTIIMCSISGCGQDGPYRTWLGNDGVGLAMGGLLNMIGDPGDLPAYPACALGDHLGCLNAYSAILAALFHRSRTGEGQYVDVSIVDSVFAVHDSAVPIVSISKGTVTVTRNGSLRPGTFPVGNLRGPKGGFLNITVNHDRHWESLARAMGRPELADLDRQARVKNQDALLPLIEEWLIASFPDVDTAAKELAEKWRVPCAPVKSVNDIIADPYLGPKNTQEVEDSLGRRVLVTKTPHHFSKTPMAIPGGAPRLGQHNREVLMGLLKCSEQEYSALKVSGVVAGET